MVAKPRMSSPERLEEPLMMVRVATEVILGLAGESLSSRASFSPDSTLSPLQPCERSSTKYLFSLNTSLTELVDAISTSVVMYHKTKKLATTSTCTEVGVLVLILHKHRPGR